MNNDHDDFEGGGHLRQINAKQTPKPGVATRIGIKYIVENSKDVPTNELVHRICGYLEKCGIAVLYD